MVKWCNIEDDSTVPTPVWLSREKDTEEWKPIRHCDCKLLNESEDKKQPVHIENGRCTADPVHGVIFHNFDNRPTKKLTSATWFFQEEDPSDPQQGILLHPVSENDAKIIEQLFQKAFRILSSTTVTSEEKENIDTVIHEGGIDLIDSPGYEVKIVRTSTFDGGKYIMRKDQKGWFGKSYELQRGYGPYTIEGEEEEMSLGPVNHVIFVIHGIGEAMWSREDVMISSLNETIFNLRRDINKKKYKEHKEACEYYNKLGIDDEHMPIPPNRIEFIPIEWYDHIHSSSSEIMRSLQLTTLTTIPAVREIANDVIFDVLMYLTPTFCYEVLECVSKQINESYQRFLQIHPHFSSSSASKSASTSTLEGKCSLIGHSLGSVICWDLLSILKEQQEQEANQNTNKDHDNGGGSGVQVISDSNDDANVIGYQHYASEANANNAQNGSWGPSIPKKFKNKLLPFEPEFTMFLGSPIGLFLTLRGAHAVFDDLREKEIEKRKKLRSNKSDPDDNADDDGDDDDDNIIISPFTLPTGSLYNIFHPSDPIAYRIEPLLLVPSKQQLKIDDFRSSSNTIFTDPEIPPPQYLTRHGEDIRLHVKVRELGNKLTKTINDPKASLSLFMNKVTQQSQKIIQCVDKALPMIEQDQNKKRHSTNSNDDDGIYKFPLAGGNHKNNDNEKSTPAIVRFNKYGTGRIDYQLQPKVIDNEYVSAVLAHNYSSYFDNADIQHTIVDLTNTQESIR